MPDGINEITQVKALAGQADIQQENPCQSPSTPLIATRIRRIYLVETRMGLSNNPEGQQVARRFSADYYLCDICHNSTRSRSAARICADPLAILIRMPGKS